MTNNLCDRREVNSLALLGRRWLVLLALAAAMGIARADATNETSETSSAAAPKAGETNLGTPTSTPPESKEAPHAAQEHKETPSPANASGFDESSFRIIADRNIFNANRVGIVRNTGSRSGGTRVVVDSFALVGTMAYEKGAFAFFEGSSSELTKVLKPEGIIAGHKIVDIYTTGVKLEYSGKEIELPIGWRMRRENGGPWQATENTTSSYASSPTRTYNSSGNGSNGYSNGSRDSRSRGNNGSRDTRSRGNNGSGRDSGNSNNQYQTTSAPASAPTPTLPPGEAEDVLKKLREAREKEDNK